MGMRFTAILLGLALATAALASNAAAKPGDLDPSFGEGGRAATATVPFDPALNLPWYSATAKPAAAADGSSAVAQGNLILRYLPNGRLDRDFGEGGRLSIPRVEGQTVTLVDIAVDSKGRVLAFGATVGATLTQEIPDRLPLQVSPSSVVVMRLDRSGQPDSSFGGGDGVFHSGLGLRAPSEELAHLSFVKPESAQVDSADRAVFSVSRLGNEPREGHPTFGWITDTLIRLTPSGELDPSFGAGGAATNVPLAPEGFYTGFCLSAGGRPVVASERPVFAAELGTGALPTGMLTRLTPSGVPDPKFGKEGSVLLRGGAGEPACHSSGNLAVLQDTTLFKGDFDIYKVVRVSAAGIVMRRSDRETWATVKVPERSSALTGMAFDGRGRILLTGTLRRVNQYEEKPDRSFFTVIRLLPSGKPDRDFGHGGWVRTGFGADTEVTANTAALDDSGRILLAGAANSPELHPTGVVLARYLPGR